MGCVRKGKLCGCCYISERRLASKRGIEEEEDETVSNRYPNLIGFLEDLTRTVTQGKH